MRLDPHAFDVERADDKRFKDVGRTPLISFALLRFFDSVSLEEIRSNVERFVGPLAGVKNKESDSLSCRFHTVADSYLKAACSRPLDGKKAGRAEIGGRNWEPGARSAQFGMSAAKVSKFGARVRGCKLRIPRSPV